MKKAEEFIIGVGIKFLTRKFLTRLIIRSLYVLAKRTDNELDEKMVSHIDKMLHTRKGKL